MSDYVDQLAGEGQFHSTGQFSLDPAQAMRKIREWQDSNLEYNQLIRDTSLGNEVCLCDCYHLVSQLLDDTKQDSDRHASVHTH